MQARWRPCARTQQAARRRTSAVVAATLFWMLLVVPVANAADGPAADLPGPRASFALQVPPIADAGPDQTLTLTDVALLVGAIGDDGLPDPDTALSAQWSMVSGPGFVGFANSEEALTTATFSATGSYVLRLTADNGTLISSDDAVITVQAGPPNTILVPQDHPTIQAAVDAAQSGDLVLVSPGTYQESLSISKTITLASTFYTTGDESLIDQTVISSVDGLTETIILHSGAGH